MRKTEYFTAFQTKVFQTNPQITVANFPTKLYKQERDWTCALACIRTLLSGVLDEVLSEDYYIEKYNMTPGPYYTKDIKEMGILTEYDTIFSCNIPLDDISIDTIGQLLKQNYFIMVESMYNYAHWYVVLGYCALQEEKNLEKHKMLVYDPFYDEVKLLNAHEFLGMWRDANNHEKEFLAIRSK